MISAILLALSSLSGAAAAPYTANPADTIRHLKGQMSVPATKQTPPPKVTTSACHPDSHKGQVCRVKNARADETRGQEFAQAGTEHVALGDAEQ